MIHDKHSYPGVPQALFEGLKAYACQGVIPGDFLQAVLSNDLFEAFGRADADSTRAMPQIIMLVYNELPSNIWRTRERMIEWRDECDRRRLEEAEAQPEDFDDDKGAPDADGEDA